LGNTLDQADKFLTKWSKKPEHSDKEPDPVADCVAKLRMKYFFITHPETMQIHFFDGKIYRPAESLIQKESEDFLGDDNGNHRTSEIIGAIKRRSLELDKSKFDSVPLNLIPLTNGIYDIETSQLLPFSHDYFFTTTLPTLYVKGADCPAFKKYLGEVLPPSDIFVAQEFFGYLLWRNYFVHKCIMLLGQGRNGKSTFENVAVAMLGKDNCSFESLQSIIGNRFSVASLYGKYANIFSDLPVKTLMDTSLFKSVTGGDTISAEKKNQPRFNFLNYAKLCFSANQLPKSNDQTLAFFERWIILNFQQSFIGNAADKNLLTKLTTEQELSGIFNWAILGLKRLLEQQDFSYSKTGDSLREEYLRKSDPVAAFCMDKLEADPQDWLDKKGLYSCFTNYCLKMKYPILSENIFHKEIQRQVVIADYRPTENGQRVQCWKGIRYKEVELNEEPQTKLE